MSILPQIQKNPKKHPKWRRPESSLDASGLKNLHKMFAEEEKSPSKDHPRVEFFKTYKNISKIDQLQSLKKAKSSPKITFLSCCDKQHLQPKPIDFLTDKSQRSSQVRQSLSERYVGAYSVALSQTFKLEKLDLEGNNLREQSAYTILSTLQKHKLMHVNLSYNNLGAESMNKISEFCRKRNSLLKTLSLEACGLKDTSVEILCRGLLENSTLKTLNLAKNAVNEKAGTALGEVLRLHPALKMLDLHWNNIYQEGAADLFDGLASNNSLQELDFSWNCLGTNPESMMPKLASMLTSNTALKHLDISFNSLTFSACRDLSEALKHNHTILGIHAAGNACYIDSLGFMHPIKTPSPPAKPTMHKRILQLDREAVVEADNCWVCGKWVEACISYPSLLNRADPVFSHLEIDDFQPVLMTYSKNKFKYKRVLPEHKTRGFFSDLRGTVMNIPNRSQFELKEPLEVNVLYTPNNCVQLQVKRVNILNPTGNLCEMKYPFKTQPRRPLPQYVPEVDVRCKSPWQLNKSVFKDYILDTPELLSRCFEFDWRHSKIQGLFMRDYKDLEACKAILKENFGVVKNAYKVYSVVVPSEIFGISFNTMFDLLSQTRVLSNHYASADFGVNWKATKVAKIKDQTYNPGHALVRYEFLEMVVRIAHDKYYGSGVVSKLSEALNMLLEKLKPVFEDCNFHKWREGFFCEEMDYFFKTHENLIRLVFNKYSKRKLLPGQRPFMSLEEFREICSHIGLVCEGSTTRIVDHAFISALMTQEDELYKKRHMEMNLLEFYEALARMCDTLQGDSLYEKMVKIVPDLHKLVMKTPYVWKKNTVNSLDHLPRILKGGNSLLK